jgi:hypothetical protein
MCDFPLVVAGGHEFPAGPVYLLFGKQWGRHKGYGVVHILAEHANEIPLARSIAKVVPKCPKIATPQAVQAVARFVADICSKRAEIACEFEDLQGDHRPLIVKGRAGTVVLECFAGSGNSLPYYSVVTARSDTKMKGRVIAAL